MLVARGAMGPVLKGVNHTSPVVLLVDDELVVRSLAQSILTRAGYRVLNAVDGEHALEVSRGYSGLIDVLLTDVRMPKMDGLELSTHIVRERPGIKILFMSGKESGELIVLGQKMEFLRKPFLPKDLCGKLSSMF
jgi:two-component system, cell cycle sensor histidine kinase and response regulator CckA